MMDRLPAPLFEGIGQAVGGQFGYQLAEGAVVQNKQQGDTGGIPAPDFQAVYAVEYRVNIAIDLNLNTHGRSFDWRHEPEGFFDVIQDFGLHAPGGVFESHDTLVRGLAGRGRQLAHLFFQGARLRCDGRFQLPMQLLQLGLKVWIFQQCDEVGLALEIPGGRVKAVDGFGASGPLRLRLVG
jgi:hypothetical protein